VLNGSIDNALAAVDNWAHAIQFRDGLGHIFRGEASITPDIWDSIIKRLIPPSERKKLAAQDRKEKAAKAAPAAPKTEAPKAPEKPKLKLPAIPLLPKVNKAINDLIAPVKNLLAPKNDAPKSDSGVSGLLDYLLGGGR
jgi:hypothetical protein